jgi:hypothetical protein
MFCWDIGQPTELCCTVSSGRRREPCALRLASASTLRIRVAGCGNVHFQDTVWDVGFLTFPKLPYEIALFYHPATVFTSYPSSPSQQSKRPSMYTTCTSLPQENSIHRIRCSMEYGGNAMNLPHHYCSIVG